MFALPTATKAHVRSFNLRTEKHGDEDVTAMDLGMRLTRSSVLLDMLHPGLRARVFLPPDEAQSTIPGESQPWTKLRCDLVGSDSVKYELVGRNVVLTPRSEMESELEQVELQMGSCSVNKFVVTGHEGGSVDIDFRIQTNDIDSGAIGMAGAMLAQDVDLSITHTEVADPPAPVSATNGAAKKDATDLFLEGAETKAPPPATAAKPETKPGDPDHVNWPFPTDPNGEARMRGDGAPPAHITEPKTSKAQRKRDDAAAAKG